MNLKKPHIIIRLIIYSVGGAIAALLFLLYAEYHNDGGQYWRALDAGMRQFVTIGFVAGGAILGPIIGFLWEMDKRMAKTEHDPE